MTLRQELLPWLAFRFRRAGKDAKPTFFFHIPKCAGTTVSGKTQIQDCATSNAYYYDVAGLQIQTAFRSIASQISTLRLTQ